MDESRPVESSATPSQPRPARRPRPPSHLPAGTIQVSVPTPLRDCTVGAAELTLSATNVRQVLEELERHYPALQRNICDETGAIRRHINLFVNTHHMRDCQGLDTQLEPGDVVTIMTAVSGG